ncbi:actin cytoskeleton-regulatory complex protein PAN1-like [Oryza brachyantha]|uniref:actin cytoskeleton-regulatory complex protein PAN1-like n=1 Tax=Oryza brachyantha TaxID=4533 RepID=UPI001AD9E3B1|nr:actin cytoskeleton-regulatory complex protein PAN1-like [Oryza brachyantha]
MDSRRGAYYYYMTAAAAAKVDATDDEEPPAPAELAPKAASQKKVVEVQGAGLGDGAVDAAPPVREDLTCPECGKAFLSDKAMYGHLRSHPQRRSRYKGAAAAADEGFMGGVTRTRKVAQKEAALGDHHHPGRSPVTGKRGRPPPSAGSGGPPAPAPAPSMLQPLLTEEEEAAMTLLDLAAGRRRTSEQPTQQERVADDDDGPPAALHRMPSVERDAHAPGVQQLSAPDHVGGDDAEQKTWEAEKPELHVHIFGIVQGFVVQEEPEKAALKEHVAAVTAEPHMPEPRTPVKLGPIAEAPILGDKNRPADTPLSSSRRTKYPVKPGSHGVEQQSPPAPAPPAADVGPPPPPVVRRIPSPASDKKFGCPVCPRTFSSYQALGGHTTMHKRELRRSAQQRQHDAHSILAQQLHGVVDAPVVAASGRGPVEEGLVSPPAAAPPKETFQCAKCYMIFPTGQALGGHKRKHFLEKEQLRPSITPSPQTTATTEPAPLVAHANPASPIASAASPAPMANGGATPEPPIASAAPPAPMANGGSTPETPIGAAAAEQPGINIFDLNELPKDHEGENQP